MCRIIDPSIRVGTRRLIVTIGRHCNPAQKGASKQATYLAGNFSAKPARASIRLATSLFA